MPADGERLIVALSWDWYSSTQPAVCQITGKLDLYTVEHDVQIHTCIRDFFFFFWLCFLVCLLTVVLTSQNKKQSSLSAKPSALNYSQAALPNMFGLCHERTLAAYCGREVCFIVTLWEMSLFKDDYCSGKMINIKNESRFTKVVDMVLEMFFGM